MFVIHNEWVTYVFNCTQQVDQETRVARQMWLIIVYDL